MGTSTHGLASGSTVAEATLHGLLELIERDAYTFALARAAERLDPATLPAALAEIRARLAAHDIDSWWFVLRNPFGVAAVAVSLHDQHDPRLIVSGQGAHLSPAIAVARALTEALQSRLSFIHGGRDDLEELLVKRPVMSWAEMRDFAARENALSAAAPIDFAALPDLGAAAPSIPAAIDLLRARLAAAGLRWVLRVVLTPPDFPMQVVRVVVPGLEQPGHTPPRVGPRLQAFLRGFLAYP
jgi:ribosomal protein S12 methylthiotransferase accessory factor